MARAGKDTERITSAWSQALRVCPGEIQSKFGGLPEPTLLRIEEIRFRLGSPVQVCGGDLDLFLHTDSGLTATASDALTTTPDHLNRIMQGVTQSSLYAVEEELRRGFVTMPGGHRVGVAGRIVLDADGSIRTMRNISSVNIRIAKERPGTGDPLRAALHRPDGRPYNVLVISPPQCGKTTLLRDLARQWSYGLLGGPTSARKVVVVDERSELAGCLAGVAQFDLGPRTDVLDGCPKAQGLLMAIRSLSPDIVVTDEIGRKDDRDAVLEATHAGVSVLASAHADSVEEWRQRPYMADLADGQAFSRYVVLSRRHGAGTLEKVQDGSGRQVLVP